MSAEVVATATATATAEDITSPLLSSSVLEKVASSELAVDEEPENSVTNNTTGQLLTSTNSLESIMNELGLGNLWDRRNRN